MSTAKNIVPSFAANPQIKQANLITLSNGQQVPVPADADPEAHRRYHEARLRLEASPKQRRSRRESGKPKKSVNYAESILWTKPTGYITALEVA